MSDEYQNESVTPAWKPIHLQAGPYVIAAALKTGPAKQPPTRIYIEGDGRAFISRDTPSGDPTPVNPVALKLALNDPTPGILYLARPCQWTHGPECQKQLPEDALWTKGRFTQTVVDAYTNLIAEETGDAPVEIIGYSGGAFLALQVAARLPNVTQVTTVAGNLQPDWLNTRAHVTSIPVAAWPQNSRLETLPTYLYMAEKDAVIPPEILLAYRDVTHAQLLHPQTIPATTHTTGWENFIIPQTTKPGATPN